jgi:hypothetical protein
MIPVFEILEARGLETLWVNARESKNLLGQTSDDVQLHHVVSDITGQTGLRIIRAIVQGQRDPTQLAHLRDPRSRVGKAKAVTATARKIAVLFYHLLKHGTSYQDPGASYEERYKPRVIRNLQRRAQELRYQLVESPPPGT